MAHRKEIVTLTNLCALFDGAGNVLVLDRKKKDWSGITFPGGHVEPGESFAESVIREVQEETGLTISAPKLVGVKHWSGSEERYIVFLYRADQYTGTLRSSEEGPVFWTPVATLHDLPLAGGAAQDLRIFLDGDYSEHCYMPDEKGVWRETLQ